MAIIDLIAPGNLNAFIELIPPVLQKTAISEDGFLFYGIVDQSEAVGVLAAKEAADSIDLLYLYILPRLRGTGIMDRMLAELFIKLRKDGYNYFNMNYLPEEYPVMRHMSKRFGFKEYVMDYGYFKFRAFDVERCKARSITPNGIIRYKYLPPDKRGDLNKLINKHMQLHNLRGIGSDEILPYSLAYMEGNEPKGALIVEVPPKNEGPAVYEVNKYPETGAYDITLFFIGTGGQKAPLYLLSGFCQMIGKELPGNAVITGYFPEGHVSRLIEGSLGVRGQHEVHASLDLQMLDVTGEAV